MSASQLKALNNSVSPQIAIATGFKSSASVLVIFVLAGLCLSFALRLGNKNSCSSSNSDLENEQVSGL